MKASNCVNEMISKNQLKSETTVETVYTILCGYLEEYSFPPEAMAGAIIGSLIGYGFFFREHHQQLLARNPYATFSELSKVIASKWRRLNRDQKQVYRNKVKKKPFSTSYGKFFRDNFKEVKESNPEATFGQISSLMSKKWDSLTWYERKSYERSTQTFHSDKKNFYNVDNANGEKPRDFGR